MNVQTPLFYRNPVVMSREKHADLRLVADADYSFASKGASVPLLMREFVAASGSMPVVFVTGQDKATSAQALLAASTEGNKFVEHDGSWRQGEYIPAYIRRYPFIFADVPANAPHEGASTLVLCIDEAAPQVLRADADRYADGLALFDNGENTDQADRALSFCNLYQRDWLETQQFIGELQSMNLLVDRQIELSWPGEKSAQRQQKVLQGIETIDPGRLQQLSDSKFLRLRKLGYLAPIYAHLSSLARFARIV